MTAALVRFVANDEWALWMAGDLAEDLGWESDDPDAPHIRHFKLLRNSEVICLYEPFRRGLVEPAPSSA